MPCYLITPKGRKEDKALLLTRGVEVMVDFCLIIFSINNISFWASMRQCTLCHVNTDFVSMDELYVLTV